MLIDFGGENKTGESLIFLFFPFLRHDIRFQMETRRRDKEKRYTFHDEASAILITGRCATYIKARNRNNLSLSLSFSMMAHSRMAEVVKR